MITVPREVMSGFVNLLRSQGILAGQVECYQKWLRYYYDFSAKYLHEQDQSVKVRLFLDKLKSKGQSSGQCQQAAHAVALYYELSARQASFRNQDVSVTAPRVAAEPAASAPVQDMAGDPPRQALPMNRFRQSQFNVAGYQETSDSPEWDEVIGKLADEIKVRHYSRKTLQTYALWSRQFQRYQKDKPPHELTTEDVKDYLTFLAVKCHVAASTQNQAFNSLLFLFRHALKRDFGELRDVPRAKKSLNSCRLIGCRLWLERRMHARSYQAEGI